MGQGTGIGPQLEQKHRFREVTFVIATTSPITTHRDLSIPTGELRCCRKGVNWAISNTCCQEMYDLSAANKKMRNNCGKVPRNFEG